MMSNPQAKQRYTNTSNIVSKALKNSQVPSSWLAPLLELSARESGLSPNAKNPSSSAYGLFQFLDSTWKGTGYKKSSDPYIQVMAAIKYIKSRYGTPEKALAFWDKNKWY